MLNNAELRLLIANEIAILQEEGKEVTAESLKDKLIEHGDINQILRYIREVGLEKIMSSTDKDLSPAKVMQTMVSKVEEDNKKALEELPREDKDTLARISNAIKDARALMPEYANRDDLAVELGVNKNTLASYENSGTMPMHRWLQIRRKLKIKMKI